MIRPEDVQWSTPDADLRQRATCEEDFDAAITLAAKNRQAVATVPESRDGLTIANIEFVAQAYRDVGWEVVLNVNGARALIRRRQ